MDYQHSTKEELITEIEALKKRLDSVEASLSADIERLKQTGAELQKSEERWKYAIESAKDGVWDWDVANSRVFFSGQWKTMLGYEEDEIGDSLEEWSKRVHPDDLPKTMDLVNQSLSGEMLQYFSEHRLLCKNGAYKWIQDQGRVVERDATGKPLRMIGSHRDISLQKKNEIELKGRMKERDCHIRISELMADPLLSMEEVIKAAIGFVTESLQYPEIAVVSVHLESETFTTNEFVQAQQFISEEIKSGGKVLGRILAAYPEDQLPHTDQVFLAEENQILFTLADRLGSFIDKKQKETALNSSEGKYYDLIENINDVLYDLDDQGTIKYISSSVEKISGFTTEEIIGKNFTHFIAETSELFAGKHREPGEKGEIEKECPLGKVDQQSAV